jgi:peptide chain release factor
VTAAVRVLLLLSAGRGPRECAWAVAELAARLEADADQHGVSVQRVDAVPGEDHRTYRSLLLALDGARADTFAATWTGTLCWQARSPYRATTGRKNWYVVARRLDHASALAPADRTFAEDDVDIVACRTGGPGGQHRNKVSTAVRATHRPTGLVVVADSERHFSANRRLALQRIKQRLQQARAATERDAATDLWTTHDQLIRGNPTRTERPRGGPHTS